MEKKKSAFSYLAEWAKPHKAGYIVSVVCAIFGVGFGMLPYLGISNIITLLFEEVKVFDEYIGWIGIIGAGFILQIIFHNISTYISHNMTFSVIAEVRQNMCDKLTRLPMGNVLKRNSGELKNLIIEKVDSIEPTLAHMVPEMTSKLMIPVVIWIFIMIINWQIGLISLITIPVGFLCQMLMMIGYEANYSRYVNANKELNSVAVEYINGIEVIKAFNNSAKSYKKFSDAAVEAANSAIQWMKGCQFYFSASMSVMPATLITVLPACVFFFLGKGIDLNQFITIVILSLGLVPPLIGAMSFTDDIAKIGTIVSDIASVLDEEELIRPNNKITVKNYDIKFKNVSFGYDEKQVLHDINLEFKEGTVNALVGPSGGGKSTITKLIASMWEADKGNITIGEVSIKDISLEQLNKMVAHVAQDNFLFDETIMENIRKGNMSATDEDVINMAKLSGCHEFIMNLQEGYQTVVGGAGGHLSGGERQRISIARAMLKNAPIIILDEATAYTDPQNEAVIQEAVSKLVKGKTLIIVAHRLSTITDSDKIIVVKEGRVHAEGTHENLLDKDKLYRELYSAHIGAKDEKEAI